MRIDVYGAMLLKKASHEWTEDQRETMLTTVRDPKVYVRVVIIGEVLHNLFIDRR